MGVEHDVGIIYICAMCESYFVLGLTSVDYTKFRGREGTKQLEDYYMRIQTRHEQQHWTLNRCPTCIECATGKSYSEWLSSSAPALLSLCRPASFEDGQPPPLYVQETAGRCRWTLAQGVGPKTLELDRSRSGRLYKPALRGVIAASAAEPYSPEACAAAGGPSAHAHMLAEVEASLARAARRSCAEADSLAAALLRCTPIFARWTAATSAVAAADALAAAAPAELAEAQTDGRAHASAAALWE